MHNAPRIADGSDQHSAGASRTAESTQRDGQRNDHRSTIDILKYASAYYASRLMTREVSHQKSFEKALYAITANFPPGKLVQSRPTPPGAAYLRASPSQNAASTNATQPTQVHGDESMLTSRSLKLGGLGSGTTRLLPDYGGGDHAILRPPGLFSLASTYRHRA